MATAAAEEEEEEEEEEELTELDKDELEDNAAAAIGTGPGKGTCGGGAGDGIQTGHKVAAPEDWEEDEEELDIFRGAFVRAKDPRRHSRDNRLFLSLD